jgi:diadenosine tetraphosphate (Ap4A) HIT family hydrolase
MSLCLFCPSALNTEQITLESEHCLFLQMQQIILPGSGIIIPKQHRETIFDLTNAEWQDTFALLHRVKNLLDARFMPDGYNVGWNCGVVGGQEVFHAHLHVIPRYADEPLAGKGIRYWLKQDDNKRKAP